MKYWLRFIILLALVYGVHAGAQPLRFERVAGLSQNTVYSILKDRMGFLWMATADGLNRYDGVEMKHYKPSADNRPGSYSNRFIRSSLLQDEAGFIWFSSGAGFYAYNPGKDFFRYWPVTDRPGGPPYSIDPLLTDNSYLWGFNTSLGILAFNRQTGASTIYRPIINGQARPFLGCQRDSSGNFWCRTGKGILYFNRSAKTWQYFYPDQSVSFIAFAAGHQYLVCEGSLFVTDTPGGRLRPANVSGFDGPLSLRVSCTAPGGDMWLGDETGNIFCRKKGSEDLLWKGNIAQASAATRYPVYSMLVDENDILWVGADVAGLLRTSLRPPSFSSFPSTAQKTEMPDFFVHSIWEEGNDVWLGTFRNGLWRLNRETGKASMVNYPGLPAAHAGNASYGLVCKDSRGNLWLGTYDNGLYVRKAGVGLFSRVMLPEPPGVHQPSSIPFCMAERNDTIFFSTNWGIYAVPQTHGAYQPVLVPGPGTGHYYDIYFDPNGYTWLATDNGCIVKQNLYNENLPELGTHRLFTNTGIKSFTPDTLRKLLWICTTSGLIAYKPSTGAYRVFTEADGLGNSYVYAAMMHGSELWLSTNNGLSRALLAESASDKLPNLIFTNYYSRDGLSSDEFNTGSFHQGKSGYFYFGGTHGVTWFLPAATRPNASLPRLVMTGMLVNEERPDSLSAPEYIHHLALPYYRNNLFFRFRGIEYINAEGVRYAYQLQNWDKDWIYSGTLNQVRYNSLPPGNYTLKVKCANSAGIWSAEVYTVTVIIHPPFWKTNWFLVLLGLLTIGFVVSVTRFVSQRKLRKQLAYLEEQRRLDRERQRISREMHDDIGAGLTQIALMSESAKSKMHDTPSKELQDIADTSRQLVGSMNEIIWSLNPENKTLAQLLAYLREQLNRQLEYTDMRYTIDFPEGGEDIILSNEQRRNILLVSKEIVNNAVRHSGADRLNIIATLNQQAITFDIADDGKGFDAASCTPGNGLRNMRHRVDELGGVLKIETAPGMGCRFRFIIPF